MTPRPTPLPSEELFRRVAYLYPAPACDYYARDAKRLAFQGQLIFAPQGKLVDVGSGLSPFALGLQELGMKTAMVDRFDYPVESSVAADPDKITQLLRARGVDLYTQDVAASPLPFADSSSDVVTCVACIEHLHNSPRRLLREILRVLKPGGRLLLGCPNAANLRKRLAIAAGRSNYPAIERFWNEGDPLWFGHVREPTIHELVWMAQTAGLDVVDRLGRNFLGEQNFGSAASLADRFLRLFPGLCSDIYLLAEKRQ